jgi:hypothetical protein
MTTEFVANRFNVVSSTARNWAAKNGVKRVLKGCIWAFDWTEDDCKRFLIRPSKGWKKGKLRKSS